MNVSAFTLAQRFVGIKEMPGADSNPLIMAMLHLDGSWPASDATAWCSAFVNAICWMLRLPRSKSLAARSWLTVGQSIPLAAAVPGYDVVVLKRGALDLGPDVLSAPGHVGFFAGIEKGNTQDYVVVLAGNQGDAVSVARFPVSQVLGVRRLVPPDASVVPIA